MAFQSSTTSNLANYSMHDLIDEWISDRQRAPLLLKQAVALSSPEEVVAYAVRRGVSKGVILCVLRDYKLLPKAAKTAKDLEAVFARRVAKLWRQDHSRLVAEVERLQSSAKSGARLRVV
jgi:hypothetical protein